MEKDDGRAPAKVSPPLFDVFIQEERAFENAVGSAHDRMSPPAIIDTLGTRTPLPKTAINPQQHSLAPYALRAPEFACFQSSTPSKPSTLSARIQFWASFAVCLRSPSDRSSLSACRTVRWNRTWHRILFWTRRIAEGAMPCLPPVAIPV